MIPFALVVFSTLAGMWFYIWMSLIVPLQLTEHTKKIVLVVFVFGFFIQIARWLFFQARGEMNWLVIPAYFILGFLAHLVIGAAIKDVAGFIYPISDLTQIRVIIFIFSSCLLANLWGTHTALSGPIIRHVVVPHESKREAPKHLRIAQISDLHVGPLIGKKYVSNVVDMTNLLNPDVIVVTGDLIDGSVENLHESLTPLLKLKSKLGVFYVTGNHEYYWHVNEWLDEVKKLGMKTLLNSGELLVNGSDRIWLGGVPDSSGHRFDKLHIIDAEAAAKGAPEGVYRILLAHQPNSIKKIDAKNWDLLLSGHTHWGQFFPFNFLVRFFNSYFKGLNKIPNAGWIYVSAGTGFWGPPLRFGIPAEITLIEWKVNNK